MGDAIEWLFNLTAACIVAAISLAFFIILIPACMLWPRKDKTKGYWRTVLERVCMFIPPSGF